jgi:hypothetical protein
MIWLTWRQQRLETLIGGALTLMVAVLVIRTGLDLRSAYHTLGISACLGPQHTQDAACQNVLSTFLDQIVGLSSLSTSLSFLPLLVGVLLAAPMALEMEQGTFRLAWTQSITRSSWLRVRLGLTIAAAVLFGLGMGALLTWWRWPADQLQGRFGTNAFDLEGTVFASYTLFALAVGLTVGAVLRRTVPTIGITLVTFLGVRFGIETWIRPHYIPPVETAWFTGPPPFSALDWVVDKGSTWRDGAGHLLSYADVTALCPTPKGGTKDTYIACLHSHRLSELIFYHPAGRFWLFQGIESGIFVALSIALVAGTVWWVRYRVT